MQLKVIDRILKTCVRLNNGRTYGTILDHAKGEMVELEIEVNKFLNEQEPGKDGIVGEAIDVILCMVDLIYQKNPTISKEYLYMLICEKLDKWERLYADGPVKTTTLQDIYDAMSEAERAEARKMGDEWAAADAEETQRRNASEGDAPAQL